MRGEYKVHVKICLASTTTYNTTPWGHVTRASTWAAPTYSHEDLYTYSSSRHWLWDSIIVRSNYQGCVITSNHWLWCTGKCTSINDPTACCRSVPRMVSERWWQGLQVTPCMDYTNTAIYLNQRFLIGCHLNTSIPTQNFFLLRYECRRTNNTIAWEPKTRNDKKQIRPSDDCGWTNKAFKKEKRQQVLSLST